MASTIRSVDFLPEIFQTPANTQFLNATLDQLIQEPSYKQTQGYVGQKVGPGVNPTDSYVVEPTAVRDHYQLEPGIVMLNSNGAINPTASSINDVITYPGLLDAISVEGGYTNQADRLFESEYYTWDPFVDFDKAVNYSQYYWLPNGPQTVVVSAPAIPSSETFTVTRNTGVYNISGYSGDNPTITLARQGQYIFNVTQNNTDTIAFRVQNDGTSSWHIDYVANPPLTLVRGNTYSFNLIQTLPLAFYIKTAESFGTTNLWTEGVSNNGASDGIINFTVPQDAPDTLYYCNDVEFNLRGVMTIVDAIPGTGPGFWIQTQPGISGTLATAHNISDRQILGVTNNGADYGSVEFDVPSITAQNFYTSMPSVGFVNLLVAPNVQFNQINGLTVADFNTQFPNGIDGITNINGKTMVFTCLNSTLTDQNGWEYTGTTDGFDPLNSNPTVPNPSTIGSYDTTKFQQTEPIPLDQQQGMWQAQYVTVNGIQYIQLISLNSSRPIPQLSQFTINYGTTYASTVWYKDTQNTFQEQPLITATADVLYYQDGTDPSMFGIIKLVDENLNISIDVDLDILGKKTYTSPNGVTFTNGLKIVFEGNIYPPSYQNNTYYVNGVGSGITLTLETNLVTPEMYVTEVASPYSSLPYSYGAYNSASSAPAIPDYITINMASPDLNPWSRSNRWFHVDVINAAAKYNNTPPLYVSSQRASRPILEFRAGTNLFNFGTEGIPPVDVIDFTQTDALLNVNGKTSYTIDGYPLGQDSLVIFAADANYPVRGQIFKVNLIVVNPTLSTTPVIELIPTSYSPALPYQTVVSMSGTTQQGISYYYDGLNWLPTQQKTQVNQAPMFDVYDSNGISFGNQTSYPSTNFTGCPLLSYAENPDNPIDTVLGFPLSFYDIDNIGGILFNNNLYTDTFIYTPVNTGITVNVSDGFVRQYVDRTTFTTEIGWQTAAIPSLPRQQFQFSYNGLPLQLDVLAQTDLDVPPVQIFINNIFQLSSTYTLSVNSKTNTTIITLNGSNYNTGDIIEVLAYSQQASTQGFYEVPVNLENNPFNGNSSEFTLGQIRQHYNTICENLVGFQGVINGENNTRDLGDIVPYGQQILQQSSPLTLAGYFLREPAYNVFDAIEYNSREYVKYKNKMLNAVIQLDIQPNQTISEILDAAIQNITLQLTNINSFYWSDMLPTGTTYTSTQTVVNPITRATFNTTQTYDFTKSNYLGLLVYLNGALLLRGSQYTVSPDAPKLTILVPLKVGDVVTINEYASTVGNWCPNTPSKMGLYPKYTPSIYVDTTYSQPATVIQGHDGSITIAFGDIRDQVLLEFEKRIYNNIKTDNNPIPLASDNVDPSFYPAETTALLPGYFRTTPYTYDEINTILNESFLTWVGQNNLDFTSQDYFASNPFTYNYSSAANRIDQQPFLQGNWRGIYRYFYDTETPDTTPWEMVGFTEEPAWWVLRYGPAPYTSGNMVLWGDLEAGIVGDPAGPYVLPEYARPGLSKIIPVSSEGVLLSPLDCVVGLHNIYGFQKSWVAGDGGPVQASWWNSSSYPFAIMRMLALTKPAQFFSLFADRDLYRYDTTLGQYLYNGRYRLNANGIEIYGNGVSKASYINWIVDYNQQSGINSSQALATDLANLDVRLCYRMASFSDPTYVQLFTERAGPSSTNNSLLIPPTSYDLLFYKNQPFGQITYSSVIVQITELPNGGTGYSVYGYSNAQPYFNIQISSPVGLYTTISAGGASVQVPSQYTDNIAQIPYGYTFTNATGVCDFLLSYGVYLESQGIIFNNMFNNYLLDWNQMCQEFLYFSTQGWTTGTIYNLNPCATQITASRPISIVDTIASITPENMLLNQNRKVLDVRNLVVNRDGNQFSVTCGTGDTINYLTLKFTNYEDMIVLNNTSQYNDLIYDPVTAARQIRLSLIASTTTEWDGQLNAQGFILNLNNVQQWQSYTKYTKGEMVLYKNTYWQAITISEPQATFNYNDWVKTDYQAIDTGLLPNLANKADQLVSAYNVYEANLTSDNDLFAFGLIGFRPRQYMADMNLSGVSQVQIYQQFLGTKGSLNAAQIFNNAILGKETGAYNVYENWGVLSGTYGAQANKSYIELQLNEALLQYNPSTIQVIDPGEISQANQAIYVDKLWKESYNITSSNILPTTYENTNLPTSLPSAGYVCLDDVDVTVFSIEDPSAIDADISNVGIGTYVWMAKINSYNWGVYRVSETPGQLIQLSDNLNGSSTLTFNAAHGLSVADIIVIKYFNQSVNGVYRVLSTPTPTTLQISFTVTSSATTIVGAGLVFHLQNARVSQASDIANLSFVNDLLPGAKVWIDDDGTGHWKTVEKQSPFTTNSVMVPGFPATAQYGASVAQTPDGRGAIVGVPGANVGAGEVLVYSEGSTSDYQISNVFRLGTIGTANFGNTATFGNKNWAVVGANTSLSGAGYAVVIYRDSNNSTYAISQILLSPTQNYSPNNFGTAAAISTDERWMYIGSPGNNTVYAYTRSDIVPQSITYTADGITTLFQYNNNIQIDYTKPKQLVVTVGPFTPTEGTDYIVNQDYVVFLVPPSPNQIVSISRRDAVQLDQNFYYDVAQSSTSGLGFGALFNIEVLRGTYIVTLVTGGAGYAAFNTITILGSTFGGLNGINNLTISITNVGPGGVITGFIPSGQGITNTNTFILNTWLHNATNVYDFSVTVNGTIQRPYLDYTFDPATTLLTFISNPAPGPGATIIVDASTKWQYVTSLTTPSSLSGDMFGSAVATTTDGRQIIVGAPGATANNIGLAGTSYVFDRTVLRYTVSTPSQMAYTLPPTFNTVGVVVNGVFLLSTAQTLQGQYTINGNTINFTNIVFNYGDIIEFESNQFHQIQEFNSSTPTYEAAFGSTVDIGSTNSNLYVAAPFDSTHIPQAGSVDFLINQSRKYGVITSTIANPTLAPGYTLRINDIEVTVPSLPNNTIAGFAAAINSAKIPNVVATATPDLTFIGDNVTKSFKIGSLYSDASSYTTVVYINNVLQTSGTQYSYNTKTEAISFVHAPPAGAVVLVVSGRLTISVQNFAVATPNNMLTVLPGAISSSFDIIGFNTFVFAQQILSPDPTSYGLFGSSISVNTTDTSLAIGEPNGTMYAPTTFDAGQTYFDENSTTFSKVVLNSGAVYTYDYFPSNTQSISNPGKFAFGQEIYNSTTATNDSFGIALSYIDGILLVGAPGNIVRTRTFLSLGYVALFNNPTRSPAWTTIRYQQPVVDVYSIDGVFSYNGGQAIGVNKTINGATQTYFDFIDPLQGKILGVARQNIDYIGAVDPAQYNTGSVHNNGNVWGSKHIGQMWWDTDTVRFIDPGQDDITYASRRWGTTFPGSSVDIYQWVESSTPPSNYTGQGTPLSTVSYTVSSQLGQNNVFQTLYYFWVKGITTIATGAGKTLSTSGVSSYINDPRSSGLPYIAGLNASTIAIYNAQNLLSGTNTILNIGFDRQLTDAVVHQEYQMITAGEAKSFLNTQLYRKFQDSLCGIDTVGNLVPDPMLSPGMLYGVQFRPRQSMFADRFTALENYLVRANTVLAQYPISETRSFDLLNSSQPIPSLSSGAWNFEVPNLEILSYQNLKVVPVGYKYLVISDSSQGGRWTIYQVTAQKTLQLAQIQNYDTPLYWYYVNWYEPGYNSSIAPVAAVQNYNQLVTLSYKIAPVGSSVRVNSNGAGKWEVYLRTSLDPINGWKRVGLEDGTIAFSEELWNYSVGEFGFDAQVFDSQYFDESPQIETRYIIRALNEEIYVNELEIERNNSLVLMFAYAYSEFTDPSWLVKTSYVNIDHVLRSLKPYQTYLEDNQNFIVDYFQEVKPYHVQVRQFSLIYTGEDDFQGDVTDYDLPAFWDINLQTPQFVSPILTPYDTATTPHYSTNSDVPPDSQLWLAPSPYTEWFNNYLMTIDGVEVVNGGTNYTVPPVITVTGTSLTPASMTAIINGTGQVISVVVNDPGSGWLTTPTLTVTGGGGYGSGCILYPKLGNQLVRSIKTTIKYDRYEYQSNIVDWVAGTTYQTGTQVRYNNEVWSANTTVNTTIFNPTNWTLIDAGTLSGVNRTTGYYTPTVNEPGLNLPLLIDGIDYPGVQVTGVNFNLGPGFDLVGFDIVPYENIHYDANGNLTYDLALLDTIYESSYLDIYLGTRPSDINVSGGAYVDAYESHAPEELLPGITYDTLDFRVYTTPGADWQGLGHGFPQSLTKVPYNSASPIISFAGQQPYPVAIEITDETQGYDLTQGSDYTVNWVNQTVTINTASPLVINGDQLGIYVYELGGGNQLYKQTYNGAQVGNSLVVPVEYNLIQEFAIFVNGVPLVHPTDFTYADHASVTFGTTLISFTHTYTNTDFISLVAIGPTTINGLTTFYSWSAPQTQYISMAGSTFVYNLTNSLAYTNPVNAIVTVAGVRLSGPAGIEHLGDGAIKTFGVAQRLGFDQGTILSSDVTVYLNDVPQSPSAYTVNPNTLGTTITFAAAPALGARIYIAVSTNSQYIIDPVAKTITVRGITPIAGATLGVTTYNDTREQRLATIVYVGPVVENNANIGTQGFDTTEFDQSNISNTPGSFDYSPLPGTFTGSTVNGSNIIRQISSFTGLVLGELIVGPGIPLNAVIIGIDGVNNQITINRLAVATANNVTLTYGTTVTKNDLYLGRIITDPARLWVSLNGKTLNPSVDYTIDNTINPNYPIGGSQIVLANNNLLQVTDVVQVTMTTESVVPEAMEFRIFQDMRGVQATYRMTPQSTTTVAQPVLATDDTIYVANASALTIPNFAANVWGAVTIDGERIMYRHIDMVANTISGLLRGTAGTGAAPHAVGALVYDIGRGNLLSSTYQDYIVSDTFLGDGTQTTFTVPYIQNPNGALEVYVGGTLQVGTYTVTQQNPVSVTFTVAPAAGVDVTLLVRQGVTWYAPGVGTPSDGVPLQETDTIPALFLQGK